MNEIDDKIALINKYEGVLEGIDTLRARAESAEQERDEAWDALAECRRIGHVCLSEGNPIRSYPSILCSFCMGRGKVAILPACGYERDLGVVKAKLLIHEAEAGALRRASQAVAAWIRFHDAPPEVYDILQSALDSDTGKTFSDRLQKAEAVCEVLDRLLREKAFIPQDLQEVIEGWQKVKDALNAM